jgi:hypothetical protein
MRFLRNIKLIVTRIILVDLEIKPNVYVKIALAMINIILKSYVLLQIGVTDLRTTPKGPKDYYVPKTQLFPSPLRNFPRNLFLETSLLKDKGGGVEPRLIFPSLCGHRILQVDDSAETENKR